MLDTTVPSESTASTPSTFWRVMPQRITRLPPALVAMVPPDAPPADVGAALNAAGIAPQRYLTVEVILEAERSSATEVITPRVLSVHQEWTCPPIFG